MNINIKSFDCKLQSNNNRNNTTKKRGQVFDLW